MNHSDHIDLIRDGVSNQKGIWADFGSGDGAFTLALADITTSQSEIYSIDSNSERLEHQRKSFQTKFPQAKTHFFNQNFTEPMQLPLLDGIIMANSLHYIPLKESFLISLRRYLKKNSRIIIVEYNVDSANYWVPYPISFSSLQKLASLSGYSEPKLLSTSPSLFLQEIYSAVITIKKS